MLVAKRVGPAGTVAGILNQPLGRIESRWISLDGLRLHSRCSVDPVPSGRVPVVCVHGLSVSSRYMVPIAERLAPYHRVYALDFPGFGRSDKPHHIYSIAEMAEVLCRWMDRIGVANAVLLGNSLGCQIIAEAAVRNPGRVIRAILVGPTVDPGAHGLFRNGWRLMRDLRRESLSSILTQGRDYLRSGPRRTVRTFQAALSDRIETKLPRMKMPTLIARGEYDPIVPQRWAEEAVRLLPDGRLAVLPGAPHAANFDAPDELAEIVLDFLGTVERG